MSRLLALVVFLVSFANGAAPNFEHKKTFELKKDEKAFVIFTHRREDIKEIFEFSWTLYDNTNMVVHTKFRKYPRQIMLSLRRGLELYKQEILPFTKHEPTDSVTLYLEFKEYKKGLAIFNVFIDDNNRRDYVEFEPNKEGQDGQN
ncbi:hypothetical protein CIG2463D_0953 [Campylobacter iguaniorum]|uniref:Uncharacterized protein n=1 Tax=Campylobacter iguaniorum TaxID=1244531 RepID=A0A076FA04_9BACT|nr:hypothetical protein [Campylobacter iguaniorum]AII14791.1 hypothetical protein CIG1485E_0953 [Campylobacter iguaniorum]ALV24526.1 hypothetical protein CIG2463D_0953 [Campylobacter iguaniorum]